MQRFISILILLVFLTLLPLTPAAAWFFDGDTLVSIDGVSYSVDDFKRWWRFYNEDASPLPKTPDTYIDWLLLAREAQRMELAEDPGFKRQTRIFLQSRTLLMLKNDTVNSRIKVTDAAVKARYEEKFLPRWLVQHLTFKNEETAAAAWREMTEGTLTIDALLARGPEQGGPGATGKSWLRPATIDPEWKDIFQTLAAGEIADPSQHNHGSELYHLMEQKGGDEEDFARLSDGIRRDLWKEQEDNLTRVLLTELRDKYQIKVDEERLAALDINADPETFTDAAVITSSQQNVSEKEFMAVIRRLMANRAPLAHAAADEEKIDLLKKETAGSIIDQSVTNWESLDRHYEEKEPFKWEYQFNYNHRLVTTLQGRLFASKATVTEEEIEQHYRENIGRYTQPTMVKLYIVDETQGPIDQIWADASRGIDFKQLLKQHFGPGINPREIPANHLDPEVKAVVDGLTAGETSQIFSAQEIRVMVHLIERTLEAPLPLERAKQSIRSHLWQGKLDQMLGAYLDTLKSRTEIKVRKRQWQAIQKELGGTQ